MCTITLYMTTFVHSFYLSIYVKRFCRLLYFLPLNHKQDGFCCTLIARVCLFITCILSSLLPDLQTTLNIGCRSQNRIFQRHFSREGLNPTVYQLSSFHNSRAGTATTLRTGPPFQAGLVGDPGPCRCRDRGKGFGGFVCCCQIRGPCRVWTALARNHQYFL